MWLRDFLPQDLESQGCKVRVLTFGYDSALKDDGFTPSIRDFARSLFDSLDGERKGENVRVCG